MQEFDPWVGKIPWRRKWQPTPVSLPGKSHGQKSLMGYNPWAHKESDTTERLSTHVWSYAWNAWSWYVVEPGPDLTLDVCLQSSAPLPWDSQQLGRGGCSLTVPWQPDEVRSARGLMTPSPKYLSMSPGPSPNSTLIFKSWAPKPYWRPGNSWCSRDQQSQSSAGSTTTGRLRPHKAQIWDSDAVDHHSYLCSFISSLLSHPVSSQFGQESYLYLWRLILF